MGIYRTDKCGSHSGDLVIFRVSSLESGAEVKFKSGSAWRSSGAWSHLYVSTILRWGLESFWFIRNRSGLVRLLFTDTIFDDQAASCVLVMFKADGEFHSKKSG